MKIHHVLRLFNSKFEIILLINFHVNCLKLSFVVYFCHYFAYCSVLFPFAVHVFYKRNVYLSHI